MSKEYQYVVVAVREIPMTPDLSPHIHEDRREALEAILNQYGAEGWDLVQIIPGSQQINTDHDRAIFKRPTNEPDAPPRRVF